MTESFERWQILGILYTTGMQVCFIDSCRIHHTERAGVVVVAVLFLLLLNGKIGEWRLRSLSLIFSGHGRYYVCSPERRGKPCGPSAKVGKAVTGGLHVP